MNKEYFLAYKVQVKIDNKLCHWLAYVSYSAKGTTTITMQEKRKWRSDKIVYKKSTARKLKIYSLPIKSRLIKLEKNLQQELKKKCKFKDKTTAIQDCIQVCIYLDLKIPVGTLNFYIKKIEGEIIL